MPFSKLTEQQRATITDRARIWEVRRFCQVLPSVVKYIRGSDAGLTRTPSEPYGSCIKNEPDGALAALLRCIVHQTGADLAMVSLLDDHTQYFVSGASRTNTDEAKVSLEDSTRWYGCESVIHHGGLCERTITQRNEPGNMAIYEELDMAELERTKYLPFVQGDIANFRHYVGVPLNPYGGPNIGTVFTFSSTPSEGGLSNVHRSYLFEIASHIIRHLEQAVEALEGKRVLKFNQGVASLLKLGSSTGLVAEPVPDKPLPKSHDGQPPLVSNLYTESVLRLYQLSATLLYDAFEFDGVRIQELGLSSNKNPIWNGSEILAEHLGPKAHQPQHLSRRLTSRILQLFPQGAVFQLLDETGEIVAATSADDVALINDSIILAELPRSFPKAEQIVFLPLWDTFHERNIGAVFGFADNQSRVYLGSTDLASISAFCTTIMTQVRRLEAQAMDKIKSDFLGSVSHEMRTPLHGMLSSLELLADTPLNARQHDLLEMARYSGLSLLDTIERVLYFSNISSGSRSPDQKGTDGSKQGLLHPSNLVPHQRAGSPLEKDIVKIISICEDIVHSEAQRYRLKEAVQSGPSTHGIVHHPILVFDTNANPSSCLAAVDSFRVVLTNLVNNALKFGKPTNCIRISLEITGATTELSCTDAGKGICSDFVRHSIFDPFSQEDPVADGTGLGLSIVKQTVTMLSGDVRIDSNKKQGSNFTITFPSNRLLLEGGAAEGSSTQAGTVELPQLDMSLFTPSRWESGDTVRDQRCTKLLLDSLTQGLSRWFHIEVVPWANASINSRSRLLVSLKEDEDRAKLAYGDAFDNIAHILLCPDVQTALSPYTTPSGNAATIAGPVTTSKLQDALAHLYPDRILPYELRTHLDQVPATTNNQGQPVEGSRKQLSGNAAEACDDPPTTSLSHLNIKTNIQVDGEESAAHSLALAAGGPPATRETEASEKSIEAQSRDQSNQAHTEQLTEPSTSTPPKALTVEPKLLLVDDNVINLKVLTKYATLLSKRPATPVGGGQEAIDAFRNAIKPDDGTAAHPYDLIFLDLSMPEVSGFDVARQIREMEARLQCNRTYICALTGLVSGKDRNAAYASGVDNYLVRPTGLKDLQGVIEIWRSNLAAR